MQTSCNVDSTTYQAPRLRVLGFVHELTRGGITAARSDAVLFGGDGGGRRATNTSS